MFYEVDDLRDDEIFLKLKRTCDAQPEKRWLPAYYFEICLLDGQRVGYCDLRIGHNDKTYIGGNIGYGIDEVYRGHHYAAKACRLLFRQAKKHGMDYLIITCAPENAASARTCELAGGSFVEMADIPEDNEMYAEGKRRVKIYRFGIQEKDLLKLSAGELVDLGICPTCFNRENGGALYGDNSDKLLYEDEDIECFFVGNPRADGHMCISTIQHYHDMSEAPDAINEKIIRFAKRFMKIICDVYGCERVYLCTMCDGPNNHYHIQLIPRYAHEKRGSRNFVKERKAYQFDKDRFDAVRHLIAAYAEEHEI